ncbi:MAG: PAS domain S-box protein, partial [Myxococcales bacterium]
MSVLADLLSDHRQALLARLAAPPASDDGWPPGLRESLGGFLDEVGQALGRSPDEPLPQSTRRIAEAHAEQRRQTGVGPEELVHAYGRLRDAIYDLLEATGTQPTVREFRVLSACLTAAVAGPVRHLTSELRASADVGRLHLLELFQQAPGFVTFLRGPGHVFEISNAAYQQLVGHRDILGKTVREALPELVGQGFYELLDRVYTTGNPFVGRAVRIELQTRPGEPRVEAFLDFVYQPIRGGDGRVLGILVQGQDVTATRRQETERQAVEEALRASEERYRTLFESIDDGFCLMQMIVDARGTTVDYRFLETNAAFEGQTGLRDAVGRTARELVPTLDESWFRLYGGVADTGETARFENHAPAMDGRWFDVYASRVGQPAQRLVALVFKDITARKKVERLVA